VYGGRGGGLITFLNSGLDDSSDIFDNYRRVDCDEWEDAFEFGKEDRAGCFSGVKFLHLNIRSYNKNFDEFMIWLNVIKIKYDLIILTETWLVEGDRDLVVIDGYDVFINKSKRNQNDGVICYVNSALNVSCNELNFHGATCLKLDWSVGGEQSTLLSVYRSPSADRDLELFISDLERYCDSRPRDRIHWLIGDINCCILEGRSGVAERYLDVLYGAGFVSCVDKPTRVSAF
jgi:hypothetical protein